MSSGGGGGRPPSLLLTVAIATLAYVPFETVAKITLVVCGGLFVFDPIPPYSRLVALLSVVIVNALSKWERSVRDLRPDLSSSEEEQEEKTEQTEEKVVAAGGEKRD